MGIPKEPRQQMINMMYLVLTALLALNISAEVLNAFKLVSDGMRASNNAIDKKNADAMGAFEDSYKNDPERTAALRADAMKAQELSEQFVTMVEATRRDIIHKSGGYIDNDTARGDLKGKRNYDVTTRIMVDEGKGKELQTEITRLRDALLALPTLDEQDKDALAKQFTLSTYYNEADAKRLGKKTWEEYLFDHVPVIAVNTILTKFQGDAKNSAGLVYERLLSKIGAKTYKFDDLEAKIIAPSSYILVGNEYKADIFVSATSKTQDPKVYLGTFDPSILKYDPKIPLPTKVDKFPLKTPYDSTSVQVVGGLGKFVEKAGSTGMKEKTGVIKVKKPQGEGYDYFPFKLEYQAAEAGLVVSPDNMNVFYIGVDNPVSISVPGFPADKIRASFNKNGKLSPAPGKPAGSFIANVTTVDLKGETLVQVSVDAGGGQTKSMGSRPFRVKRVPDPVAMIGPDKGGNVAAPKFKVQKGMQAVLENFDFNIRFTIVGFEMTYAAARQDLLTASTDGALFSQRMIDYMAKAKPGDVFYFDKIRAKGPDGTTRTLPGIVFKLN